MDLHLVAASKVVIGTAGSTFSDMAGSLLVDGEAPLRAGRAWGPNAPTATPIPLDAGQYAAGSKAYYIFDTHGRCERVSDKWPVSLVQREYFGDAVPTVDAEREVKGDSLARAKLCGVG